MGRIEIEALSLSRGGRTILDGIDLTIEDRAFVALIGPSGAGKTSLLRVIAGLDRPDAGRVGIVAGQRIGYVTQRDALFPHMTVADNVAFAPAVRGGRPDRAEIARSVERHLAIVGMEAFARRLPGRFSGGQRQRVALARALAAEPAILLLDEPFGALDEEGRAELRSRLRAEHEARGLTTMLVTHDREEAQALADRVLILRDGRIA